MFKRDIEAPAKPIIITIARRKIERVSLFVRVIEIRERIERAKKNEKE